MALANFPLIEALRKTAVQIESGARYSWAHMGSCNCGHLAQVITGMSAAEIHSRALEKEGNWSEQSERYAGFCPQTGFDIDYLIDSLIEAGLNPTDIRDLEFLSNIQVLKRLPGGFRYLSRNRREDVSLYVRVWASLLEAELSAENRREFAEANRAERTELLGL
ncbi:MAG: hypothetical protein AAGB46_12425 [Verrucomicrobiota bacterium]